MKKIVLTFGIIAGIIVSAMLLISFIDGMVDFESGKVVGYLTMIIALSTIFFGIKTYRDKHQNGSIKFGKAFKMGLYISLIASTMYVASWMILANTTAKGFMDDYYTYSVEQLHKSNLSQEEIEIKIKEIKEFQEIYKKPAVMAGFTYLEILPIGLIISLLSASILKRKNI
ncbi:MAG: DUF4199 domain-containing protein [Marinilabiliales bacterium]|nr:MAG: DUF4199 domain-containing protein [Marinilabiliales bacterium]